LPLCTTLPSAAVVKAEHHAALERIREEIKDCDEVNELVRFVESSKRGVIK